jgi:hypothetical protein
MNTPRKNSSETTINKGVELMLRRASRKNSKGLKILQTFVLLKKLFSIRIEFTWEDVDTK